jgi:hypothetical protein
LLSGPFAPFASGRNSCLALSRDFEISFVMDMNLVNGNPGHETLPAGLSQVLGNRNEGNRKNVKNDSINYYTLNRVGGAL